MENLYRRIIEHFDFKIMRTLPIYRWNWDATGLWSMPEVLKKINNVWNNLHRVANYENTGNRSINAQCALYLIGYVIYKRLNCTIYPDGYPGNPENFLAAKNGKVSYSDHCHMIKVVERLWRRKRIQEGNIDQYVARIQYETGMPLNSLSNDSVCRDSRRYFRKFLDARYSEKDLHEWSMVNLPHGTGTQSSIFFDSCMDLFRHGKFDGEIYDFDGLESYLKNSRYSFQKIEGFLRNLREENQRNMAWQPDYSVYFNGDCFYVDFTPKNRIEDGSTIGIEVLGKKNDVLKNFSYRDCYVIGNPLKKYPISEYTSYRRKFKEDDGNVTDGNSRTFLPKNRTWILKKKNDSFELCRGAKLPTEDSFPVYVFPPHGLETDIPQKYEITISQLDISRQGYKFDSLQEFEAYREKLIEEVPEYKEVEYKFNVWSCLLNDFVDKICSGFFSVPSWARWKNSQNGNLEDIPQYESSSPRIGKIARSNGDDRGRKSICIVPNGFKYEFIKDNHGQYSGISLSYEDGDNCKVLKPKQITDKNGNDLDFSNLKVHDIVRCHFEDYRIDILSPVPGLSWTFGKDCSFVENNKEFIASNCMSFAELALVPSLTNPPKEIGEGLVEFNLKMTLYAWNKAQAGYSFNANLKKGKKISTDVWLYSTNLVAYKSYVDSLLASVDDLKAYVEICATFDSREEKIYICRSEPLSRRMDQNGLVYFSILKADTRKQKPTDDDLVNDIWIKVPVTDLSDRWQWDGRYRIEKINDFNGNADCLTNLQRILVSNDNAWERLSNYLWADTKLSDADYELRKKYHDLNVNHKVPLCNLWLFQAVFHNDKLCSELNGLLGPEIMKNAMKYPFEPELMRPNHRFEENRQNDISLQEKTPATPDFYDEHGKPTDCEYAIDSIVRLTEIETSDKDYRRNHSKCVVYFRQLSQIKSRLELLSEINARRNNIKLASFFQDFKGIPEEKILSCIATENANQTTMTDAMKKRVESRLGRLDLWNKNVYEGVDANQQNPNIVLNGFFEGPAKMLDDPTLSNEEIAKRAKNWGRDIARVLNYCSIDEALEDCGRSMEKIQLDCSDEWRHLLPLQDNGLLRYDLDRDEKKREIFRADLMRNVVKRTIVDGLKMSFDPQMDAEESFLNMVNNLLQKKVPYEDLFESLIIQCRNSYIGYDKDFMYWKKTFDRLINVYNKNGSPQSYQFEYIFCTRDELDEKIKRKVKLMPTKGR